MLLPGITHFSLSFYAERFYYLLFWFEYLLTSKWDRFGSIVEVEVAETGVRFVLVKIIKFDIDLFK
jgi:hypothetical protein